MKRIFILLVIFFNYVGIAQFSSSNYTIKWVNADDGLKQLSVRYCVPDNDGFIWIATELGLYRYDGANLVEIKDERYPSLSKQRITRLGKDEVTGKVYLETNPDNTQYVIDNDKIERIDPKQYQKNAIFNINGTCFSDSNPLIKAVLKKTQIKTAIAEYDLNAFITAVLTNDFFYLPQNTKLVAFDKNGSIRNFDFKCTLGVILLKFDKNVLAVDKGKITLFKDGKIVSKTIKVDANIQSYINRKLINQSNFQIFGFKNDYFLKFNNAIFKILYRNDVLTTEFLFNCPSEDITSISYLEKEKVYFLGTQTKGMAILKPINFNTILVDEKYANKSINYCYSVAVISDKNWYSASGWCFNPKNKVLKIDTFLIDNRSTRFILPYKNKFYNNSKYDFWNIKNQKNDYDFNFSKVKNKSNPGFSSYTYHKGQLYLSNAIEIYFLKDNILVTDVGLNRKFTGREINGIFSLNNVIIIPTSKGVFSFSPKTKKVSLIKGLEKVNARYIKPINKESYWVGCYGEGLFLVDKNKVNKVTDTNIELTTAHAIEEDKAGNLWISTNDGLLQTNKREAFYKIKTKQPLNCYKYSTNDGLLTNEFNGGGTHPSLQTNEGIIGFPSMKGFVWFQPLRVAKHLFKGKIVINSLIINNKINVLAQNDQYNIPQESNLLSFNISYGYYFNRENITALYRFEDQPSWTEIKGNEFQITRHKQGKHKLIIKISTQGFPDNQSVITAFNLDFEQRFYETFLFWCITSILSIFIIYLSYLIGLNIKRKKEKLLEIRIEEKTALLKEIVLELENSKNIVSKSLHEKDLLLKEVHHRVKNNLQLIISMLNIQARRNNYSDIHEFLKKGETRISSMALIHQRLYQNDEALDKINFQLYIKDLVSSINQTFDNDENKVVIKVNTNEVVLNLSTAIPLGLIINELVTNALKHAFPNNKKGIVTINIFNKEKSQLKLIIEDNGIGFNKDFKKTKSFGLELINLLASQLKGNVAFENINTTKFTITFQEIDI